MGTRERSLLVPPLPPVGSIHRLDRQVEDSLRWFTLENPEMVEEIRRSIVEHRRQKDMTCPNVCHKCGKVYPDEDLIRDEKKNKTVCLSCLSCYAEKYEYVDRPSHYDIPGLDIQAIDIIHALGYGHGFVMGNLIKMAIRCGRKPGMESIQDMEKSRWYLDDYIKRLKEERDEEE